MDCGDGTNADYEAFAVNDDNGGDLTSGNITIGAKDSGFNGATALHLLMVDSVGAFADGSFSITTQQQQQQGPDTGPVYVNYCNRGVAQDEPYMVAGDGTNAVRGFAINDDNGGDLASGNATIGAKDSGFNSATTFTPPGDGTLVRLLVVVFQ